MLLERGAPMPPGEAITVWLQRLQEGDEVAAQRLWEEYFRRLVGLARKRLVGLPRRAADEEDVALSAFDSFCRGAEQGRFPRLDDRDELKMAPCNRESEPPGLARRTAEMNPAARFPCCGEPIQATVIR